MDRYRLSKMAINLLPDTYDSRDYTPDMFVASGGALEPYQPSWQPPIYDQGNHPMCAAYAMAAVLEIMHYRETGQYIRLSPGMLYSMREKNDWQGDGLIPREVLKIAQQYGSCPYDEFPVVGLFDALKPVFEEERGRVLPLAQPFTLKHYYHIPRSDIAALRATIVENGFAIIAWNLYESVADTGSDGMVAQVELGEYNYGGHMSYVTGIKECSDGLRIDVANSWGLGNGDNGHYYLPLNYAGTMAFYGATNRPFRARDTKVMIRPWESQIVIQRGEDYEIKTMDTIAIVDENNRILMPIRYIAEAFGLSVYWNQPAQIATVADYEVED